MHHMKKLLAARLARRAEASARATRRELRDHIRREELRATDADIRARGLRLYIAWLTPREHVAEAPRPVREACSLNLDRTREVLARVGRLIPSAR